MIVFPKNLLLINALQKKYKVPGISIVMIENAKVAFEHQLGVKNSQTNEVIKQETLFEVASLSKPVFAYGVLKLVEDGQLDLDKPLAEYISYSDVANDSRLNLITARMVLAHVTGFPNWRPKNESLKIYFQPGNRFSYSGEGFVYLQRVVEHSSGMSLEQYMHKNVFIPLGMHFSTFNWVDDSKKTSGHDSEGLPFENQKGIAPNAAFTMHTNASDYGKFVLAIIKGQGLKSKTIDEMLQTQVKVPEGRINSTESGSNVNSKSVSWGLGWGLQRTSLGDSFWHWGDNQGFKSFVMGFKNSHQALIIFTNSSNGLELISEMLDKYTEILTPALEWLRAGYAQS